MRYLEKNHGIAQGYSSFNLFSCSTCNINIEKNTNE